MGESKGGTEVGDHVIIWITGSTLKYVAEVTESDPLRLKVEETGPYSRLKGEAGDFIILESDTAQFRLDRDAFIKAEQKAGRKVFTGLKSLGIEDDELHEMLPG